MSDGMESKILNTSFFTKPWQKAKDYLKSHGMLELNLRDLMDLFLPPASDTYKSEDDF